MPNNASGTQIKNGWEFSDGILYDMCTEHPEHTEDDALLGKLLIIGRVYAASLQRTGKSENSGDEFFTIDVLKGFNKTENGISRRKILDDKIEALGRFESIDSFSICEILSTHRWLTDVFYDISKKHNRSLASKYLHFHLPNLFYIYDSRADRALKAKGYKSDSKQMKMFNNRIGCNQDCHCDSDYAKFVERAYRYNLELNAECGEPKTPRELDTSLLDFGQS